MSKRSQSSKDIESALDGLNPLETKDEIDLLAVEKARLEKKEHAYRTEKVGVEYLMARLERRMRQDTTAPDSDDSISDLEKMPRQYRQFLEREQQKESDKLKKTALKGTPNQKDRQANKGD